MAELKGEFIRRDTGFAVRVTIQGRKRRVFLLAPRGEAAALERARVVCDLAADLRRAQQAHTKDGLKLLDLAALGNARTVRGTLSTAKALIAGELEDESECPTFAEVSEDWTSGKLHAEHPDHVKSKDSHDDAQRLKFICAVDLGGTTFGELPIDKIRIDHCEDVMRALPGSARRPATRRHYAQVMSRVLQLAAFPLRLIEQSPLPKGFLPRIGRPPAFPYLYPEDDRALLACTKVPLGRRVYWGWVAREGGRKGETARLQVRDFDLVRGIVRVDENKTDDPRSWVMTPGVPEALRAWVELSGLRQSAPIFRDDDRADFVDESKTAQLLRSDLELAGIRERRPELFEATANRRPMRMHDLRGTFVTLSLAAGRSETWVADRTGHKSSIMINRYRRRSREAEELDLGVLDRLDQAIPELAARLDVRPFSAHVEQPAAGFPADCSEESSMISTVPKEGLEPPLPFGEADFESIRSGGKQAESCDLADLDDAERRGAAPRGQDMGNGDPVEAALAEALTGAAKSGQWEVVAQLAKELEARRLARAGVVDLAAVRRGKGER